MNSSPLVKLGLPTGVAQVQVVTMTGELEASALKVLRVGFYGDGWCGQKCVETVPLWLPRNEKHGEHSCWNAHRHLAVFVGFCILRIFEMVGICWY